MTNEGVGVDFPTVFEITSRTPDKMVKEQEIFDQSPQKSTRQVAHESEQKVAGGYTKEEMCKTIPPTFENLKIRI